MSTTVLPTTTSAPCPEKVCRDSGKAMIFPLFGASENNWPDGLRIVLYMAGLFWTFMGVAIVADVFMGAIEKVTSKKKHVFDKSTKSWVTYTVWNGTIANLTLMALGSSAPEILLGIIEITISNSFYSGALGPSTIVGSAAFNLFVITAVCVMAIPDGEVRMINDMGVFAITGTCSVLAYLWLWMIVSISSENVITMWESILTFLFFPIMVVFAFAADKGYFSKEKEHDMTSLRSLSDLADMSLEEVAELEMQIQAENKGALSNEQVAKILQARTPKSRAHYRVAATRDITGGRKVNQIEPEPSPMTSKVTPIDEASLHPKVVVAFVSEKFVVSESCGSLAVGVQLIPVGNGAIPEIKSAISVEYKARDGTAKEGKDYKVESGRVVFKPGEITQYFDVAIVDDDALEHDEEFYIDLSAPIILDSSDTSLQVLLPKIPTCTVMILDDDNPGTLSFEQENVTVVEGIDPVGFDLIVNRKGGCKGDITCKYKTQGDTATEGRDYEPLDGVLEFTNGQASATIHVTINPRGRYEKAELFRVVLTDVGGGACFERVTDGGADSCITTILIEASPEKKNHIASIRSVLQLNYDKNQLGHSNWRAQFMDAIYVGGEEGEKPGVVAIIMHVITVFWKVLFACIPPPDYCDGWICFVCALIMIGFVTTLISDLASLLGCVMGLPDPVTAITFVALGTSLPDTFASKAAAEQDPYADASIGNVTGSNSVNVFLGIGLSWMAGTFYWASVSTDSEWAAKYPDIYLDHGRPVFVVIGGDLGKSVIVFCTCAVICLGTLVLRRKLFGGELGGPKVAKIATAVFFVCLWFVYVGLSTFFTFQTLADSTCK